MSIIQAVLLGILQGATEFLPISSSGHLLLAQRAMGITETGLTFDVALHLGTLAALILFFYKDILKLTKAIFVRSDESRLAWLIVIATIPAAVAGFLLESTAESTFRSVKLVSINLAAVGVIMLIAEKFARRYKHQHDMNNITRTQALTMGVAQALAIVPGVSRSGSTITAGLFTGLSRVAATRFSFLLGIPITAGAILKVLTEQDATRMIQDQTDIFIIGMLAAFITGILAIKFMLRYLALHSLAVFAYYRIGLAALVLLGLFATG